MFQTAQMQLFPTQMERNYARFKSKLSKIACFKSQAWNTAYSVDIWWQKIVGKWWDKKNRVNMSAACMKLLEDWGCGAPPGLGHVEPFGPLPFWLGSPVRIFPGLHFESSFLITTARRSLGSAGNGDSTMKSQVSIDQLPFTCSSEKGYANICRHQNKTRYQIKNTRNQPTKKRRQLRQKSLGKVWGTLSSRTDKDVVQQFHCMPQARATEQSKCNNVSLWLPAFCTVKAPNHAASKDRFDASSAASIKRPPRPCPRNAVSTWEMKWLSEKSVSQWENGLPCAM